MLLWYAYRMYAQRLKPLAIGLAFVAIAAAIAFYIMSRTDVEPEREAEALSDRFPRMIGNYARSSDGPEQVRKREECIPRSEGELCMTTFIAEYRQTDGNNVVFVNTVSVAEEDEGELRSFIAARARSGPAELPGTVRVERHELGWHVLGEYDFILIQEGVYTGNSVSYATQAQGTNPVTKYFLITYPPTAAK